MSVTLTLEIAPEVLRQTAQRANVQERSASAVIALFEQGATVPFIARYRKAQTFGLDEVEIREVQKAYKHVVELRDRKEVVLKSIDSQGKLTPELRRAVEQCDDLNTLEDLYLPYKPKRKTKASVAREQGLAPLAELIRTARKGDLDALIRQFITGDVCTPKEALQGAQYIIAEEITEDARVRARFRTVMQENGAVCASKKKTDHEEAFKFDLYEDFSVEIPKLKPHQLLALNRGEALGVLNVRVEANGEEIEAFIARLYGLSPGLLFHDAYKEAIHLAVSRYLNPSLERETRKLLKEIADVHAIQVFSRNLRALLLQAPIVGKVVMGIDPGFASGCKVAVVDEQGHYLEGATIYPTPPRRQIADSERLIANWVERHGVAIIAIGNGTASRETEAFVADTLRKFSLPAKYMIVNEAGASVYSASEAARIEFPKLDAALRGNISIARRAQDPLAELVKIDPKSLGVGLYQHDVDQSSLENELEAVVESCVNEVGVDLNTASAALLARVAGLNARLAQAVVDHRTAHGPFRRREELLQVKGLGPRAYEQCAGFLRIREGVEPLDNTAIHPESYDKTRALAEALDMPLQPLGKLAEALIKKSPAEKQRLQQTLEIDPHTFDLIVQNLQRPGRDPREDAPPPILRSDVLSIDDLQIGMPLKGVVRNVVDFGAFVDVGLKNDALLHVSKMGRHGRRVRNPLEVVQVGDVLEVVVDKIEAEKQRVSLALDESKPGA